MARLTKTQAKRMLKAIDSKSKRLWSAYGTPWVTGTAGGGLISTADMIAIEKIVARNLKRLG